MVKIIKLNLKKKIIDQKINLIETMRRCDFFLDVFGLELPEYLKCGLFPESSNPEECVGYREVKEEKYRAANPACSGFLCDQKRCLPADWRCDGHVDCFGKILNLIL